ncbi:DUF1127 domain-containing protein [Pararhodobacter zhoushanensis]|uniref:DUF1127 domain-containing protein n=1 Tax=Pararhodobacter zhoushanensis TaxID=2479545 RepID=A0ABT3H016_9RHOB|nr:DUF1127 domain-containing protein [Pararhodobacter zhoushanensis]MCW1933075.1 DUF1127 domain-containing protein [Pararhodobacter zhoushanensis]
MSRSLHAAQLALLNNQAGLPSAARALIVLAVVMTKWDRHRRTRKALHRLEPHLLKDIGFSRAAAEIEAGKPFWRD